MLTSSCLGSCLCLYLQGADKVDLSGRGRWWLEALKVSGRMWSASSAGPRRCAGTLVMKFNRVMVASVDLEHFKLMGFTAQHRGTVATGPESPDCQKLVPIVAPEEP